MGKLCFVAGVGHCGSQWLAWVLNKPQHEVRFHHELSARTTVRIWELRQRRIIEKGLGRDVFPKYWDRLNMMLPCYEWVGDALSWLPMETIDAARVIEPARIVYLVRNGIRQLHSVATESIWQRIPTDHWLFEVFMRRYWVAGESPDRSWEKWSKWEKLCFWWATNGFMPDVMRSVLSNTEIEVVRLEDLVENHGAVHALTKKFGFMYSQEKIREIQKTDLNRKVKGDRRPITLWYKWTPEQRRAFREICMPTMERLGYKLP